MRVGWAGFGSPLIALLFVVMVSMALICLWQVRNNSSPSSISRVRAAAVVGLSAGSLGTLMVTQVSWTPRYRIDRIDLDPFDDFSTLLSSSVTAGQFFANLALLSWVGFFLPLAMPRPALARLSSLRSGGSLMLLVSLCIAGAIEFGQLIWTTGRVSSVSDVLINSTGCMLGYVVSRHVVSRSLCQSFPLSAATRS